MRLEVQLVERTGWTLETLDQTDIDRLFPFYFELMHTQGQTGKPRSKRRMLFADEANWL